MSMAYGFYWGVFYPYCSPPYEPPDGNDPVITGSCFAAVGQPENYHGFLYQTAELLADNIFYA